MGSGFMATTCKPQSEFRGNGTPKVAPTYARCFKSMLLSIEDGVDCKFRTLHGLVRAWNRDDMLKCKQIKTVISACDTDINSKLVEAILFGHHEQPVERRCKGMTTR
eukprot:920567-Amphidinium_carterae.2